MDYRLSTRPGVVRGVSGDYGDREIGIRLAQLLVADPCDPPKMGDLDGDGLVAFADFLVLSADFGDQLDYHSMGDIDCDGTVAFGDFFTLSSNFGGTVAGAKTVPEPSGGLMLLTASVLLGLSCILEGWAVRAHTKAQRQEDQSWTPISESRLVTPSMAFEITKEASG